MNDTCLNDIAILQAMCMRLAPINSAQKCIVYIYIERESYKKSKLELIVSDQGIVVLN